MLHVTIPARRTGTTLAARIMTPANYLRLRRGAAGLTIAQVAEVLMPRMEFRSMTAAFLQALETDGYTAKNRIHIERLAQVFPLDPEVYYQLVVEPTDRQPPICSGCGCSAYDPCNGPDGPCQWRAPDACGVCLERAAAQDAA
jgi:hypothetical protein